MAAKLRYPTGVRPLLVEETARRRRVESRFVSALEHAGFAEVVLPIIDYATSIVTTIDPTATRATLLAKRMSDDVPDDRREIVEKLIGGEATIADVAPFAPEAAARLRAIGAALNDEFVLHLDDVDEEPGYYTGIRFRVYANGGRRKVAQG